MSSTVWRLRMFARRAIPHTPAKRWGYGAAVLLMLVTLLLGQPVWAAIFLIAIVSVRVVDLRRSGSRRGRIPTEKAYFFESEDDHPALKR